MVSTMEQCESKSIGPLASTLAIFDTFKNQDEDKDSDEESFHLPLLDDDTENVKEILSGTDTPCGETEDDILNKFETEVPPDLDATLEENILDEDENVKTNTTENDTSETVSNIEQNHSNDDIFQGLKVVDEIDEESENKEVQDDDQIQTDNDQMSSEEAVVNIDTEKNTEQENDEELQADQKTNEDANKEDEEVTPDEPKGTENDEELQADQDSQEDANKEVEEDTLDEPKETEIDEELQANQESHEDANKEDEEDTLDEPKQTENNEEFKESIELEPETENIVSSLAEECEEATEVNDEPVDENEDISDKLTEDNEETTVVMDIDDLNNEDEEQLPEDEEQLPEDEEKLSEDKDEASTIMNDDLNQEDKYQEKDKEETIIGMNIDYSNSEDKPEENLSEDKEETTMDIDDLNDEDEEKLSEDKDTTDINIADLNNEDKSEDKLSENIEEAATVMDIDDSKEKSTTASDIDDINNSEKKINDETTTALDIDNINKSEKVIDEVTTALDIDDTNKHDEVIDEATTALDIDDTNKHDEVIDEATTALDIDDTNKTEDVNNEDLNCDDLLDISAIRDADEDDAIAAEVTESDTHLSEKFDIDERENKRQDEMEEMEMDQDYQVSTERDEPMESDDNTNSCDRDTSTTDNLISDGESKDNESIENKSDKHKLNIDDTTQIDSSESTAESVEVSEKLKDASVKPVVDLKASKPEEDLEAGKPKEDVPSKPKEVIEKLKENTNKRPLTEQDEKPTVSKKMRIDEKTNKINTLINFEQFMKKRNLGDGKLTRSDLEQFCLQKICEAIIHKTDVGELHQTIKKQENIIDTLRKDILQLTKQARDLDIVNKKLMNEIKTHNGSHKPLVPLKITRSVGLQVKLNIGVEPVNRRKPYTTNTPRTPATPNNNNNSNTTNRRSVPQGNTVVRQILSTTPPINSPRKTLAPAPILTQALQNRPTPTATQSPATTSPAQAAAAVAAANKRTTPIRPKPTEPPSKPSAPGVIDLTDEDDKIAKTINTVVQKSVVNNVVQKKPAPVKMLNKSGNVVQKGVKTNNSPKTVGVKAAGTKIGMQPRAMAGLPQGVRLTTTQMKNGITLPAGVVTTNAQGGTQLMYVVQPGSLVNSTAGGGQKAVLLNFQPTNGVLTSTINGSTVSVIPSKPGNTMQVKQILPVTRKHPAPLPHPPLPILNNSLKKLLPKPHLSIRKTDTGIILQWRMPYNLDEYEGIASYQLFAYQETSAAPSTDMWRKVGDVKALALPMACTLTQFADKNKYYFAVRSIDVHKRIGAFSDPEEISL